MDAITTPPATRLLEWYDRHHRDLPWRVSPAAQRAGERPDPYRVWLSEIMLQQTTVATVKSYFEAFTARWPRVEDLAGAESADVMAAWAGLGYYARARNLHACAKAVAARGVFPDTEEGLRELPGIGPYTAAAVAAIAFDRPAAVMDGNVERVMSRLFAETTPLPKVKETLRAHAARLTPTSRAGDYAQAVMDLGATICTPTRPACGICPWMEICQGRIAGIAESLPVKPPKVAKPVRFGRAYAGFGGGKVFCITRPPSGLLGGMLALPSGEWAESAAASAPPFAASWQKVGEVRHTFTHFHLRLEVLVAEDVAGATQPIDTALDAMPTVFKKALKLAASSRERA
ncbi:MAG: A/G-specific adenine glycosylase [Pseudomonadota bacterium]